MSEMVWVSLGQDHLPYEVFDSQKLAVEALQSCPVMRDLVQMDRMQAIGSIRHAIWFRQRAECIKCGTSVTLLQMHMHEKLARGKFKEGRSGNISLENSEGLCAGCHIGPQGEHGDRRPHFSLDKNPKTM